MHEEDTHADGRRFVQGANVALATTRMSHLANKNGSSATAVFDGSMSSKMLCYGDLVTLGIDGVGYLAPREHMSCKQQDDGPVSLLCAPCDGNGPAPDFQTRCVWRVESGGHGVGATESEATRAAAKAMPLCTLDPTHVYGTI